MSKELEVFRTIIKGFTEAFNMAIHHTKDTIVKWEGVEEIENALKDYEVHEQILNDYGLNLCNFREACLLLAMLKGSGRNIHDIDKKLEALEIIKKKIVLIDVFIESESANDYNEFVSKSKERHLTQEEYELLKEVLL